MVGVPVRDLASAGIITDLDAYDLTLQALSMGVNARCENGRLERGPVARRAGNLTRKAVHAFNYDDAQNAAHVMVVDEQGYVSEWSTSAQTDYSPAAGWTAAASPSAAVTSTILNDVLYINREDRVPWYRAKSSSGAFGLLSGYNSGRGGAQFDANLRFKSLRATANILVGINLVKNGVPYPNTVRWSDFADQNVPPRNWDLNGVVYNNGAQTQSSVGGENTIAEMRGSLVDGCKLGNNLVLYSTRETWMMEFVGGISVFNFRRLFDSGILSVNCAVEKEGIQYVFGDDDIYMHDGNSNRQSLAQGRVRQFVYRHMVKSESYRSFVVHNKALNEIMFCYTSSDPYCHFKYSAGGTNTGCNRAAVYNYAANGGAGTWYLYDLPWVTTSTTGPIVSGATWTNISAGTSWNTAGGSWSAQGNADNNAMLMGSNLGTQGMYSYGLPDAAATAATIDLAANGPMYLEKIKVDLDELKASLRGYKRINGLDIEGVIAADAQPVTVTVGASDHPSEQPIWGTSQTFDAQYSKIDCNQTGRFLAFKMEYADLKPLKISGFDLDLSVTAQR